VSGEQRGREGRRREERGGEKEAVLEEEICEQFVHVLNFLVEGLHSNSPSSLIFSSLSYHLYLHLVPFPLPSSSSTLIPSFSLLSPLLLLSSIFTSLYQPFFHFLSSLYFPLFSFSDKFGSASQRSEFLPGLCSMDLMASYCLTEPGERKGGGRIR
jgi:hypothetical protein